MHANGVNNNSIVDNDEYNKIIYEWNATEKEYSKDTIHDLFEQQVNKTPDHIALIYNERELSYKELNEKSNQLAHYIRLQYVEKTKQSLVAGTLIAMYLDRSLEMVIGILAILKAGGAYVPIDPDYPEERTKYILEDTGVELILTQRQNQHTSLPEERIIYIDLDEELYKKEDKSNLPAYSNPTDLAYIIYTSGTTGRPKGAMLSHSGIVNRIEWMQFEYPLGSKDVVLQKTPYVFDVSVWELLWANWYGAKIVMAKPGGHKDNEYLFKLMEQTSVTALHFVPSMLGVYNQYLLEQKMGYNNSIKYIFCSGEALSKKEVMQTYRNSLNKNLKLHNLYGPTEASIDVTYFETSSLGTVFIGRPIQNTQVYVVDPNINPVPIGVIGELYIGGAGLARGYLNKPELTKERFVPNPFATEADKANGYTRLYKTGDLVRWTPDGNLEYIGRNDDQVKIRGYRIELGEIEHALMEVEGIKQACVLVKERKATAGNTKYLVGYCILEANSSSLTVLNIKKKLIKVLPDYMVPSALVLMESFPLTINGKLDKHKLPEPDFNNLMEEYVAPATEMEIALCCIWQDVLGLARVGIKDDFFRIGGNSIHAIEIVAKLIKRCHKKYAVTELLKNKTISGLIKYGNVQNALSKSDADLSNNRTHHFEQLIFNHELSLSEDLVYNESFVVEYEQPIRIDKLIKAIENILLKNEILHSNYKQDNSGVLHRIINIKSRCICEELQIDSVGNLSSVLSNLEKTSFDLSKDKLIRFYLITAPEKQILFIITHHLILDATSFANILLPELYEELFNDNNKSNEFHTINEFNILSSSIEDHYNEDIDSKITYWKYNLLLCEPIGISNSNKFLSNKGDQLVRILNADTLEKIQFISEKFNISVYSVLFGLFSLTVSKFSGKNNLAITTNIDERMFAPGHKNVMGCFINNAFIINQVDSKDSLSDLLIKTSENILKTINNLIPFSTILNLDRELVLDLAEVHFNIETQELHAFPYVQSQIHSHSGEVSTGLYFELDVKKDRIFLRVQYQTDKYEKNVIESLLNSYINILNRSQFLIGEKLSEISLLNESEYNLIIHYWNATDAEYPKQKTIHELFDEQAKRTPDNIALVYEGHELTYKELNEKSNQLSFYIREKYRERTKKTLVPDTLIALCLDRSLEMIVGILAVLKAGGAYVPVDPGYPKERIDYILNDTNVEIVLTQKDLKDNHGKLPLKKIIDIDLSEEFYKNIAGNISTTYGKSTNLAYVIYTSGTTGKPKGVLIEHHSVINLINFHNKRYSKFLSFLNVALVSNYNFDFSVQQIFNTILYGHTLHIISKERILNPQDFNSYLLLNKIEVFEMTPSLFSLLILPLDNYEKSQLKLINIGGENLSTNLISDFLNKKISSPIVIINTYGPTESTSDALVYEIDCQGRGFKDRENILIGKPIDNIQVFVLDANFKVVPIGVIGELYIGGAGLARGYLNRPDLTLDRFISNPFATESDKLKGYDRLYKTGDLVRWLPGGDLEYIGRNDSQVKIRGFRIELGEIEYALLQIKGIKEVRVVLKERKSEAGDINYLVAYYLEDNSESKLNNISILNQLTQVLPDYMVPNALVLLDSFPLTVNGKLDIRALPDFDFNISTTEYVSPSNEIEKEICSIWQKALGVNRVGTTDDFFKLGGNSILAIQVSYQMTAIGGYDIKVADIFKYPTCRKLLLHHNKKSIVYVEGEL